MSLNKYIRIVQDFPKKGIIFKDITPLLINPLAREE
jgi:adenine phosphoribosyltransferase